MSCLHSLEEGVVLGWRIYLTPCRHGTPEPCCACSEMGLSTWGHTVIVTPHCCPLSPLGHQNVTSQKLLRSSSDTNSDADPHGKGPT